MFYQGQWFYGVEELNFLAQQLSQKQLNLNQCGFVLDDEQHQGEQNYLINIPQQLAYIRAQKHDMDYYFCFDDPLSYIYLVAASQLADYYQIKLNLKPILLDSMTVPSWKSQFAHLQHLASIYNLELNRHYVLSPKGLTHCHALFFAAQQQQKPLEMTLLLLQAIWTNAQDLSYMPHVKTISAILNLHNTDLKTQLKQDLWHSKVEQNTAAWLELDLPHLPSFYLQGERRISFCGAQRLWAIEMVLVDNIKEPSKT